MSKKFPEGLLSPLYNNNYDGRSWYLLSLSVRRLPSWVNGNVRANRELCFF